MQYPTLLEYMKAIQDAGVNLDKLTHLSVVLDGHGEPCHISGDSSVVFKMQDKTTGKCYALKCFTKAQKECADASSNSSSVNACVYLSAKILVFFETSKHSSYFFSASVMRCSRSRRPGTSTMARRWRV